MQEFKPARMDDGGGRWRVEVDKSHDVDLDTASAADFDVAGAARAVEDLRNAEAHLARRRHSQGDPGDTDRAAMRLILERAAAGEPLSPKDLAEHLQMSSASVSALLQRLATAGLAQAVDNPQDGRRKLVTPTVRGREASSADPMDARIRALAADLSPQEAELISGFLRRVTQEISRDER